ncbi:cytochrome c oxidase subunit 3 [Massilia sp. 9I]|uniref:cytochrome c oxidase subunit 3 n=1 Tax=Massilia sp. 9I TaxID=2653152 RepID=UPI0012F18480|nr:cytochrome c oxidase subunit 3 [Massilia sp. 9I]VXB21299.1 conserved membrane hypothetical protein [Massilia sp. 9I]
MDDAIAPPLFSRTERLLFIASFVAYAACLLAPAFVANDAPWPGWGVLLMGPIGVPLGYVAWLANPLLWYAWFATARGRHARAVVSAIFAILLAFSFLLHQKIPVGSSGDYPFSIRYGFGLWLFSMALAEHAAYLAYCRVLRLPLGLTSAKTN